MNKDKYIRLFACCIPVKGYRRSLLCDLQRSKVKLIPNELFDLLDQHQNNTINELLHKYPGYEENINEYINFYYSPNSSEVFIVFKFISFLREIFF